MNTQLLLREAIELTRREALARPQSFDATARTIEAVVATDAPVQRRDQNGAYVEILDIAGADLEALRGASVLDAHQQHNGIGGVIGTVEEGWREGNQLVARIRLTQRTELAPLIEDIASGLIRHLSVGYEVAPDDWQESRDGNTRTRTAKRWKPREVSFVPVSADPNARTRSQQGNRATINRQIRELATRSGASRDVADDLIDRDATIEEARAAMFDNLVTRGRMPIRTAVHNDHSADNPEAFVRAAGEALYMRAAPAHTPSGLARQYIGARIADLAAECLRRSGQQTGFGAHEIITRALHTTSDFALILGDTVGRTLRASYQAAPSGIRQLARQTTANDFRKKSRLMFDSSGFTLEKVNEHGEFKSGSMTEAGESYKLETFGKIFGITRQALVNDDLGAFTDLTRRLGQAAAAFEAQTLVDLLVSNFGDGPAMLDETTLFDVDHGNVAGSGVSGVPSDDTLSAARLAMRRQTGPGGGLISVTPKYVLNPPELETDIERLLTEVQAIAITDISSIPVFSWLIQIVEPRLTDPNRYYVVADPNEIDGLEYAYLAGQPGPQIETQAGFRVDGVEIKVRLDFGCGFVDWRGWYLNKGQ